MNFNGGTFAIDVLSNAGPGSGHDFLSVNAPTKINALTNLTINLGGYAPAIGQTFTIIDDANNDPITGGGPTTSFRVNGIVATQGTTFTSSGFYFQFNYAAGFNSNDIVLTAVIPEPGSVAMLLGGFGLLAGFKRFRRRAA